MYNKKNIEKYNNSDSLNKIKTECDCYDSINRKDKLFTPCAVNIPIDDTRFNTSHNIESNNKMTITGKYCFPIEKFLYDGVWNGSAHNINDTPNKQTLQWNISNNKEIEDIYCGDKLLILPEKRMLPGDVVIGKDNTCDVKFPHFQETEECHKRSICDDIKKTTLGEYTINGL